METVTVNDHVRIQVTVEEFQNFRKKSLLEKTTRVFDRLGYYVLFDDEQEILESKRFVVKSIIDGFKHPTLSHADFKTELTTHLDIIEAYYIYPEFLRVNKIEIKNVEIQIEAIKNWLLNNEFSYQYVIAINEYYVSIRTNDDIQMLDNIEK